MPRVTPRRPHDPPHPPTRVSRRDEAGLAVVAPVVRGNRMEAGKDLDGIGKVEPAVFKRGVTLRRIEGDPHDFLMYPQKCKRQYGGTEKITPLAPTRARVNATCFAP